MEIDREEADHKHAAALAALTTSARDRQAQHDVLLARTNRICSALQERLLELEAAISTADQRHAADTAVSERLGFASVN